MKTSSGVARSYRVLFCWNALSSVVWTSTVSPVFFSYASKVPWNAFFGTASEELDPMVTTFFLIAPGHPMSPRAFRLRPDRYGPSSNRVQHGLP